MGAVTFILTRHLIPLFSYAGCRISCSPSPGHLYPPPRYDKVPVEITRVIDPVFTDFEGVILSRATKPAEMFGPFSSDGGIRC